MNGEQRIKLTPAGRCSNPRCGREVYAELMSADLGGFLICPGCEERHGHRLREAIAAAEGRPHCSEPCCRRREAA